MFFVKQFDIADNEKAFLFKKNRFAAVLEPGKYRYWDLFGNIRAERFDITRHELEHGLNKFLVSAYVKQTQDYLEAYQLNDYEVGLCYRDGRLVNIMVPGSFKVYWKGPEKIELKRIDISADAQVPKDLLVLLGRAHNQQLQRAALLHGGIR
ncbi:hypothetical protein MNBD_GAMMA26-1316 [hydrothermal vent metagenome]|uniref:Uncharacterized protein n=1 Tax=hydrothermal vent metagenome TaxID=652676 RepID=A0A3B1BUW1_9ZZZZ